MTSVPFDLPSFAVTRIFTLDDVLVVSAQAIAREAMCPLCHDRSTSIHSTYTRTLSDLPVSQRAVRLILRVRRFRCLTALCSRRTFAERLPLLTAPHAQRTTRLTTTLHLFADNLSAQLGAGLLRKMRKDGNAPIRPIFLVQYAR